MHSLHKEVTVADDSLAIAERGAVYDHVLTYDVLITNYKLR